MEYNAKILIAEESSVQRQMLKDGLSRAGYRFIEEAINGEDAMIKAGRVHPDIMIVDIWLSKIDGIGVVRENAVHLIMLPERFRALSSHQQCQIRMYLLKQLPQARNCAYSSR